LTNQAKATLARDPQAALMLGLAAEQARPDAEARRELTGLVTSTRYAGSLRGVDDVVFGSSDVVAAMGHDRVLSLWNVVDPAKPARLARVESDEGYTAHGYTFSRDGRTLAVSYLGPTYVVILWDVADPTKRPARLATLPTRLEMTNHAPAPPMAFSPDGRTFAMTDLIGDQRMAVVLDITNRTQPKPSVVLPAMFGWNGMNRGNMDRRFAFSSDGRTLVTGSTRMMWDVTNPANPIELAKHDDSHEDVVAFSPVASVMATASNGAVTLWDTKEPARRVPYGAPLKNAAGNVDSVTFSPDGRIMTSSDVAGITTLWDVTDPAFPVRLDSVPGYSIAGSTASRPDGRTILVTVEESGTARFSSVEPYGAPQPIRELKDHSGWLLAVAFSPDGRSMATAGADRTAIFWDMTNPARPRKRGTLSIHDYSVRSVAFSQDLRTVAAAGLDGRVKLWDVTDPDQPVDVKTFEVEVPPAEMTFSPDGRTLALARQGPNATLVLWDLADLAGPTPLVTLTGVQLPVTFSPDSRTMVSGRGMRTGTVWDLTNRSAPVPLSTLGGLAESVGPLAFSPDGRTVATRYGSRPVMLWDVTDRANPHWLAELNGTEGVESVAFNADGSSVATSSAKHAMLWDIADRNNPVRLARFPLNASQPSRWGYENRWLAVSPDGRTLAFGGSNNRAGEPPSNPSVLLWDYTKLNQLRANPAKQACAMAGAGFTREQWARRIPEVPYKPTCPS